jgi:hypothetical protein
MNGLLFRSYRQIPKQETRINIGSQNAPDQTSIDVAALRSLLRHDTTRKHAFVLTLSQPP